MSSEPTGMPDTATEEGLIWLDDLQRCDGFNPCGECDRCTEGGKPWFEAWADWRKRLRCS